VIESVTNHRLIASAAFFVSVERIMKWGHLVLPSVAAGGAGVLGWLFKGANIEGAVSPGSMAGIAVTSLIAGVAFFQHVQAAWAAAGGKLDGRVTNEEARAVINAAATDLKLPQTLASLADDLAPQAAALTNGLIQWMSATFTDNKPPAQSTPDKVALLMNAQQAIAWELANDKEGAIAVAKVLERLHSVWNTAPVQTPATIPAA
jgi:hypothetical protein